MGNGASQIISLPQGGGALQGIGEKFSPDLHTGTGNFTVPIAVPPGRNGFQPQLNLTYSSGNGNGPFGLGWGLSIPGITRKTSKGIPRYQDADHFAKNVVDTFILSGAEDLVPVFPSGPEASQKFIRYRPRTEGLFARIDHIQDATNNYWQVKSKDGLTSLYGTPPPPTSDRTWQDPAIIRNPANYSHVFAWRLTKTIDTFGNLIAYDYVRDSDESGTRPWDQLYVNQIQYVDYALNGHNDYLVAVLFKYQDRPDVLSEYRSGFEMRTQRRCKQIIVKTRADKDQVVRSYTIIYVDERPELASVLPINNVSLISQIQMQGHDGDAAESLPPLEFSYTQFERGRRKFVAVTGADLPPVSLSNSQYELVDLFGNGLPDVLEMNGTVRYWRNQGAGRFDRPREMKSAPAGLQLGDKGVQLLDADGDGRLDLLVTQGALSGYYPMRFDGLWDQRSFQRYRQPSFDLKDAEVRLLDLTGDGVTDAVRSGTSFECFFHDQTQGWAPRPQLVSRKALDAFPNVPFSDPRVKWADLNGDGMQDISLVHNGSIEYWPNVGYGNWGSRTVMKNSPHFPLGYDPKRILLGDIDGDGLADVIYVDNGKVTIWMNQSGNRWSDPIVIRGTPSVSDLDSVRLVDLFGNGVAGLLWTADIRQAGKSAYFFLDFTGGTKPYLLNEMDNHIGASTHVDYAPSTHFYLLDEKTAQARWKTPLPFPVQVVSKVTIQDQVSGGKLTTEYRYHHGYWDGAEREFRGFGRVDHRDTQTFDVYQSTGLPSESFSPPTETRTWFHQGPIGDEFGEWGETDFSLEFWSGDKQVLQRPDNMAQFLKALPRRTRRDALRSLRGRTLRSELYALDGSDRETRPYTVTESIHGISKVEDESGKPKLISSLGGESPNADATYPIFFPHTLAERITQWERGTDPLNAYVFTGDYDRYGFAHSVSNIAVPRSGAVAPNNHHLITHTVTAYAQKDENTAYIVDRVVDTRSYEISQEPPTSLAEWQAQVEKRTLDTPDALFSHKLNFYDGDAFKGLPYGQLGEHGALVRSESLILTQDIIAKSYSNAASSNVTSSAPYWNVSAQANWPDEYPQEFRSLLLSRSQADATRPELTITPLGYGYHGAPTEQGFTEGYFVASERRSYDFQEQQQNSIARGLITAKQDPLGSIATMQYDPYQFLPTDATDAAGLQTHADYDYRVLQAKQVTEANGNRTEFQFSALGLLQKKFVRGKQDRKEGDDERAGLQLTYDLATLPIFVHSTVYPYHDTQVDVPQPQRDEKIQTREYTDGFGRLLQKRTQAEIYVFGDPLYGDCGLSGSQDANGPAMGKLTSSDQSNVVVSGWQVYDNKGQVVEKFEPCFAKGWAYERPAQALLDKLQKVKMYYDPRGHVVRTLNPDGSEQRVLYGVPGLVGSPDPTKPDTIEPTPWEAYTYDPNDIGFGDHKNTPGSLEVDGLGRTVRTVERNGTNPSTDWYTTRSTYDIRGNVLMVDDQLGRQAFQYLYDFANRPLRTNSMDAGIRTIVYDAAGNEIERRDSKGALTLREYDSLKRPTRVWARDIAGTSVTLREQVDYGDASDPNQPPDVRQARQALNLLGKLHRHYDEAGLQRFESYDFKGNVLEKVRRVIKDEEVLSVFTAAASNNWTVQAYRVDWQPPVGRTVEDRETQLLSEVAYQTSTSYDALNRIMTLMCPQDVDGPGRRKILMPHYNSAGALERVEFNGETYVERIAYNAKGQRILISYGNGLMTRYLYDAHTFRLQRLRTEPYSYAPAADSVTYTPGTGIPLQDFGYTYDLVGNILTIQDRTPGCGVINNPDAAQSSDSKLASLLTAGDALSRRFGYDPLYRLREATGRECANIPAPRGWFDDPRCGFNSSKHGTANQDNAPSLATTYWEKYNYDPAGNMLSLQHGNTTPTWTRSFGMAGMTPDQWSQEWPKHVNAQSDWANARGNRLTHLGDNNATTVATHSYDDNGNLITESSSRHFEWDHSDRMRAFRTQTNNAEPSIYAHYFYDAGGQRVKKLVRKQGGQYEMTNYIDGLFEHHHRVSGGTVQENNSLHIIDNHKRIALVRIGSAFPDDAGPAIQYHLGDHLGSNTVVVDKQGGWINREEYLPYGETSFGSFGQKRYRYTGKERDEESGLNYHGARYYAPWVAKWSSCDPLMDGFNKYSYGGGNPLRFIDPLGAESKDANSANSHVQSDAVSNTSTSQKEAQTLEKVDTGEWFYKAKPWYDPKAQGNLTVKEAFTPGTDANSRFSRTSTFAYGAYGAIALGLIGLAAPEAAAAGSAAALRFAVSNPRLASMSIAAAAGVSGDPAANSYAQAFHQTMVVAGIFSKSALHLGRANVLENVRNERATVLAKYSDALERSFGKIDWKSNSSWQLAYSYSLQNIERYSGPILSHLENVFFNAGGGGQISRAEVRLILERPDLLQRTTFNYGGFNIPPSMVKGLSTLHSSIERFSKR